MKEKGVEWQMVTQLSPLTSIIFPKISISLLIEKKGFNFSRSFWSFDSFYNQAYVCLFLLPVLLIPTEKHAMQGKYFQMKQYLF